jgi:hypothetical protein
MGGVAWHQYFGGKMNNGKLAGKLGSVWINNNNIFHRSFQRPGTDVIITIFCDFHQFSAKKLAFFLQKRKV